MHDQPGLLLADFALEGTCLQILQKLLKNNNATWTCQEQKEALQAILAKETDVLVVMATGSGKSMLAFIPALLEPTEASVIVLPLTSLITDYECKMKDMGIEYELFEGHEIMRLSGVANLIIVSENGV